MDLGFEPDRLITIAFTDKGNPGYDDLTPWVSWDILLDEIRAIPGVESVAGTSDAPLQSPWWTPRLLLPGDPPDRWRPDIAGYGITPGYLETMGTELLRGRDFEHLDGPVRRRGGPEVPAMPFAPPLEAMFMLDSEKIANAMRDLAGY